MTYKLGSAENETHRVTIYQGGDVGSPRRTETNVGTFLTWHRDYNSPDDNPFDSPQDFIDWWGKECRNCEAGINADDHGAWIDNTGGDVCGWDGTNESHVPLAEGGVLLDVYMIDHGNVACRAVEHGAGKPNMGTSWDTGQVGYIYVTADKIKEEWGRTEDPIGQARNYLIGEVERYSQWASGDVYGFRVDRRVRHHVTVTDPKTAIVIDEYDEDKWQELDDGAMWGFYGWDVRESGMAEYLHTLEDSEGLAPDTLVELAKQAL